MLTASRIAQPFFNVARDRTVLSIWGVAIGSWIGIFAWSASKYSVYLGHSELQEVGTIVALLPLMSLFLLGWSLMVFAMMLPTTLPLVKEFQRRTTFFRDGGRHMTTLVGGSVSIWIPLGISIYIFDLGIHKISEIPQIQGNIWILGFSSLAIAGAYQFTRKKRNYLEDCCFPSDYLQTRLRDNLSKRDAFRIGLGYGRASVGSHWALMLLMFSLGLGSILGMLLLGIAMGVEHEQRIGEKARIPIGILILVSAAFFVLASFGI